MTNLRGVGIGKVQITRLGKVRRGEVFALATPHRELQLYVSESGRSLRVWDPKLKKELKP